MHIANVVNYQRLICSSLIANEDAYHSLINLCRDLGSLFGTKVREAKQIS